MIEAPTLWQLIEDRARATPSAPMALDERGRTLDFEGYRVRAERLAAGLAARGIGADDIVSWMLPTRLEALLLVGALARLGAVQNPILPIYREREVGFIAGQIRPRLLITPGRWRDFDYAALATDVAATVPGMQTLALDGALPDGDPHNLAAPPRPHPPSELPVRWLFYTSGTTAEPKGAKHTDASLWAAAKGMSLGLRLDADDRIAFVFPITHIGGINWVQAGLASGCQQVLIERFASADTIEVLRRARITQATAGTVFHEAYLAAHRACGDPPLFPDVRTFPGGGAPKPPKLHAELRRELGGAGIVSGYGMTECPIVTMNRVGDPDEKLAETEGCASLPDVELRIVDREERTCGPGEEGEIRVRGPQLFRGYTDPALDTNAFDGEGFLRTGDLGRLDSEGYLTITGRAKDVIIRKGENIPAKEVEDLLYAHPKVSDVAVIGLPDPETGERACAVVACRDASAPLGFDEMVAFLRERKLMVQKIPERLELVDAVPRNATGKILKHELRARFASA